jgi:hypothetical protein
VRPLTSGAATAIGSINAAADDHASDFSGIARMAAWSASRQVIPFAAQPPTTRLGV